MGRYHMYLNAERSTKLKNALLASLRELKTNKVKKISPRKNKMKVSVINRYSEICIKAPIDAVSNSSKTSVSIYLGTKDTSALVRNIKDSLLELRLHRKERCR